MAVNPTNPTKEFMATSFGDEKADKSLETVGTINANTADAYTIAVRNGGK